MPYEQKTALGPLVGAGAASALVAAIPLFFWVGIGGALVSAVVGAAASTVASAVLVRVQNGAREALEPHAQLAGVLDSSQLDGDTDALEDAVPLADKGRLLAVAVALSMSLATGCIVAAATGGMGINFYLGNNPAATSANKPTQTPQRSDASSSGNASSQSAGIEPEITETWYPEQSESAEASEPAASADTTEAPAQTPESATDAAAQDQATPQPSPTPSEPSEAAPVTDADIQDAPTAQPSDGGTIVDSAP